MGTFAEGLHNLLVFCPFQFRINCYPKTRTDTGRDLDGDGKADDFEVITDDFGMSGNYHEFNFTPVKDKQGNYFFALGTGSKGDGCARSHGEHLMKGRPVDAFVRTLSRLHYEAHP